MGPFQLQLSEKGEACAKALGASVVFIVVQQPRAHGRALDARSD